MGTKERVTVVAAVIRREGRYLVGRRPLKKRHGGLWEFPGGKVHDDEDSFAAARRELDEELALEVTRAGATLHRVRDGDSPFVIHFVEIEIRGEPTPLEHDAVGWFTAAELVRLPLAPADADFVRTLQVAEG